ncbi:flagellar hook-associated protein 2 [Frondihabitans sp. PhB188]|uniref:flagellar filament capping protein FliD n=1 Tax=Frondihabitans sp. PhB188 TaxID=2485200 RepID=UPI000F4706FA|nr:flagellar filament capping protein FliD [Frondihabitans sp. PhB188]ROQ37335.1 flagellar hook-associated protein 2 [Frondihabitans sp. PhB188]
MAGLAVDGLVSGLDTTSLINSLMTVESQPQTLLKAKVTSTQSAITALQGLNTQVAALATAATTAKSATSLSLFTASTSSTTVTATASTAASAGSIDFTVGSVAQAKTGVTAAMSAWPSDPATLSIVDSTGKSFDITAKSTSLDDVVTAVNASGSGVKAVKVASGTAADGSTRYRLQFTAQSTGTKGDFTVLQGGSDLLAAPGAAVTKTAQDATVTLWAGTSAEQTITSNTNTFADLLPGVSVTVTKASTDPVTVTVAQDQTAASKVASGLVDSLNGVFGLISTKSAIVNSTDSSGKAVVSGGPFTGDSTVRGVNQSLVDAASLPVNGKSPSEIGISITRDGILSFDADKFAAAMAADPEGTQAMFSTLTSRVADAANQASDKYDGQITGVITGQQSLVTSMSKQVDEWDLRLTDRRASLEKLYSALEVQLSNLQSQATSLTSSLANLPTYS